MAESDDKTKRKFKILLNELEVEALEPLMDALQKNRQETVGWLITKFARDVAKLVNDFDPAEPLRASRGKTEKVPDRDLDGSIRELIEAKKVPEVSEVEISGLTGESAFAALLA